MSIPSLVAMFNTSTITISGYLTYKMVYFDPKPPLPLINFQMHASNGGDVNVTTYSDQNGFYLLTVPSGFTGALHWDWQLWEVSDPASFVQYQNLQSNQVNQNILFANY